MTRRGALFALLVTFVAIVPAVAAAGEIDLEDGIYGGFYSSEFFAAGDLDALGVASSAPARVTFAGTFHHVGENDTAGGTWSNTKELLNEVWLAHATPFANVLVDGASAEAIAAGDYDAKIEQWAGHVERYLSIRDGLPDRRLIIAPLQEGNGTWVSHGCDPASYRLAFRRFVDIFRARGIDETEVRWAFAPNGWTPPGCGTIADYYPGDDYVDVLAFSAYNFGECFPGSRWTPPSWAVDGPIDELTRINAEKPIIVAQTAAPRSCEGATTGGDQAAWLTGLIDHLRDRENVAGFIWFNVRKTEHAGDHDIVMDWRIWDTTWVSAGWRTGLPKTVYRWPLSDWFRPGALTIGLERGTPPCAKQICDSVGYVDSAGQWLLWDEVAAGAAKSAFSFGSAGNDVAFMGDWDGDGVATPGWYRRSDGMVLLRNSNTDGDADVTFFAGEPGDYPLVGDFNGDGMDTVSIYRPSDGEVFVFDALGGITERIQPLVSRFVFGIPGDQPFVGDWNGDGIDTIGLYRASTGLVYLRDSLSAGAADLSFPIPDGVVLAGDWNGDGVDTVGIYRPSMRRVYLYRENSAGADDYALYVGDHAVATTWGRDVTIPTHWLSVIGVLEIAPN